MISLAASSTRGNEADKTICACVTYSRPLPRRNLVSSLIWPALNLLLQPLGSECSRAHIALIHSPARAHARAINGAGAGGGGLSGDNPPRRRE